MNPTTASSTGLAQNASYKAAGIFGGVLVLALLLTWLLTEDAFTVQQSVVLFVTLFSIGLWVSEAAPPFAVALMIIAALVFTLGYRDFTPSTSDVRVYTDTLSSSVIWLLLGGFCLASAMTKTGLSDDLIAFSLRVCGTKPHRLLFGMMTVTMIASMVMSNSTTTAMVIAALMPVINRVGKQSQVSKALILGIPIAASTGGMATLIGSPTNLLAAGAAATKGVSIDFVDWLIMGLPVALLLTYVSWWMLVKLLIKDAPPITNTKSETQDQGAAESKMKRAVVMTVLLACVLLWLTSPIHGFSATAVAAIPLVILPLAGILKGNDIRSLSWDTLILVAGGLALGEGLMRSGLMNVYADRIVDLGISPSMLMLTLAYLVMLFSNAMSNSAACAIFLPLGMYVLPNHIVEITAIIGLAASTSLFLPVSTPPNAIAYSTGIITQKDFLYGGVLVGVLGPPLIVAWVLAMA